LVAFVGIRAPLDRMIALDNGFEEAVGIVADARASATRLCAATGFVERYSGTTANGALEVLIGHSQAARGSIRLVQYPGAAAGRMRDGAQAWDIGGIFDINLRALAGIAPLHEAFAAAGFVAHAPITDWDFGALSVREVVESDADGLCIALMERVRPPLTGYDGLGGAASWVFNSTQIVPDFDAARALYRDALGWQVVQETRGFAAIDESGVNCMGLPLSLAPIIPMQIGIYHPQGRMEGSVEVIAFGVRGHDLSATCVAPNRGWAALRFPMSDLAGFAEKLRAGGCVVSGPEAFVWEPYGAGERVVAVTPWGARLEAVGL
jgi:catechol 2,3-dioxygenase-like lactoylglutathione lyase family enzyme